MLTMLWGPKFQPHLAFPKKLLHLLGLVAEAFSQHLYREHLVAFAGPIDACERTGTDQVKDLVVAVEIADPIATQDLLGLQLSSAAPFFEKFRRWRQSTAQPHQGH